MVESPQRLVEGMRLVKSDAELGLMRHSARISGEAFAVVRA